MCIINLIRACQWLCNSAVVDSTKSVKLYSRLLYTVATVVQSSKGATSIDDLTAQNDMFELKFRGFHDGCVDYRT